MRTRLLRWAASGLVTLAIVAPASGVTYNSLNFFVTQIPNVCTAGTNGIGGSYYVTQPFSGCGATISYNLVKGAGSPYPWASEMYWYDGAGGGWIRQEIEVFYNDLSGSVNTYRALRDRTTGSKGIKFLPRLVPATGVSWNPFPYTEEMWDDGQGHPVCSNSRVTSRVDGSVDDSIAWYDGLWANWISDCRSGFCTSKGIRVLGRRDRWGGTPTIDEYYYYGQLKEPPGSGTWKGVGLVKWEWYENNVRTQYIENHYLVSCSPSGGSVCTTCPP